MINTLHSVGGKIINEIFKRKLENARYSTYSCCPISNNRFNAK